MEKYILTNQQARRLILTHQNLWQPYRLEGKTGILDFIRRVGCIQYDPLNISGHNHELVLQSRVNNFIPSLVQELLYQDRSLIDAWDKNMSIYPTEDWPYFQRSRQAAVHTLGNIHRPAVAILPQVREKIQALGPLSSLDLDFKESVEWSWSPTRISRAALESMYFWGELIIHHKVHTRRVYDFARRHIPDTLLQAADPNLTSEQYHDWYILRRIGSVGLLWNRASDAWLGISGIKSKERGEAFGRLIGEEKLIEINVEGINQPLYMRSLDLDTLERVLNDPVPPFLAAFIAPLDNLLWDRRLIKELFNFDYKWEVYKPAEERRYGYYVLPVLIGDRFVARFEPGRDKKNKALIIKNWWWEDSVNPDGEMSSALLEGLKRFITFLGADHVQIDQALLKDKHLDWIKNIS